MSQEAKPHPPGSANHGAAQLPKAKHPPSLSENLASFSRLPGAAKEHFLAVLGPNLAEQLDDRAASQSKRFCRQHEVDMDLLADVVRACRHLLLSAVKHAVNRDAFAAELAEILADKDQQEDTAKMLLEAYDHYVPALTKAAIFGSIAQHGQLIRKVHWRVDTMRASDLRQQIDLPLATITFDYVRGAQSESQSFQLLPEQALELRDALNAILG